MTNSTINLSLFIQVNDGLTGQEPITFVSLLPLVAPVVIILTFTIDRIIAFRVRRRESERSWYLKAYFENSIKKVDEFFEVSEKMMMESLSQYESISKRAYSKKNHTKKIEFIAEVNSKFTDLKRKFEINVLSVFNQSYPKIKTKIEQSLMDFEDACSNTFDDNIPQDLKFYKFIEGIYLIKSKLIIALSQPAISKEDGFFKRIWKFIIRIFHRKTTTQ